MDDTRPGREGKITRFLERRQNIQDGNQTNNEDTKSMIDVTFRQQQNDMFGELN